MTPSQYSNLLIDLNAVLVPRLGSVCLAVSEPQLKRILDSGTWHDFERDTFSWEISCAKLAVDFALPSSVVGEACAQYFESVEPNIDLLDGIKTLKKIYPHLRVFCISNLPAPYFRKIQLIIESLGIFDNSVFSSSLKYRKPELGFYQTVLRDMEMEARSCVMVETRSENAVTAQVVGMYGLLHEDTQSTLTTLNNQFGDPVQRGMNWLYRHARKMHCETDDGLTLRDNFAQLFILECTHDGSLVYLGHPPVGHVLWNFYIDSPIHTTKHCPDDADTTSLALLNLEISDKQKIEGFNAILSNCTADGLPLVYFDNTRPRFCPVVAANVLRLFAANGQGTRLAGVLSYLTKVLRSESYNIPSRYYLSPDWLLYYLSDLCARCVNDNTYTQVRELVSGCLTKRMGCDIDPLNAALRLVSAQALGLRNIRDLEILLKKQQLDGGWEIGWLYKFGMTSFKIGSRGIVTAVAIKGILAAFNSRI